MPSATPARERQVDVMRDVRVRPCRRRGRRARPTTHRGRRSRRTSLWSPSSIGMIGARATPGARSASTCGDDGQRRRPTRRTSRARDRPRGDRRKVDGDLVGEAGAHQAQRRGPSAGAASHRRETVDGNRHACQSSVAATAGTWDRRRALSRLDARSTMRPRGEGVARDGSTPPPRPLPTCPDCGGMLHVIRTERLTSAEVAERRRARCPRCSSASA